MSGNKAETERPPVESVAGPPGFARTPEVLRDNGPQMEDFADWDSWHFARQRWLMARLTISQGRGEK